MKKATRENVKFTNDIYKVKQYSTTPTKAQQKYTYQNACIDMLPLRTHVKKEKMLIANMHTCTRAKHIHGADAYDKSRQLSAMNKIKLNNKYVTTWYAIIDNKKVLLSKYIKKLQHYHIKYILDTKLNKKIYVNGNIYELKYTTAR